MRTNGNLALNPAYKPSYQPTKKDLRHKSTRSTRTAANAKARRVNVMVIIFYVIIISAIAFYMVAREINIYELSSEVRSLSLKLDELKSENQRAILATEKSVSLRHIENIATNQLGMVRPEKYQTVYISIEQDDYVEKVASRSPAEEFQQSIVDGMKNLFGIFDTR